MWYVVQVLGGQEKTTLNLILQLLDHKGGLFEEAFIPHREVMRHRNGKWVAVKEILFPGYIFISTNDVKTLSMKLSNVPAFTRLLGNDCGFAPLATSEVELIQAISDEHRVVRMSEGIIEGSDVRILHGPLRDLEATIVKIDRHKRCAFVKMRMFGREVDVKLGLEIVRKTA